MAVSLAVAGVVLTSSLHAGSSFVIMGHADLVERLGLDGTPTGAGVRVAQIEGLQNGHYAPNVNSGQFAGKSLFLVSGPSDESAHATNVGSQMYGNTSSMAHGTTEIWCYSAIDWIYDGFLRTGLNGVTPRISPPGMRVKNNSWIANLTKNDLNIDALRRADWTANNRGILIVSGVANNQNNLPLMSHMFNGITVGKLDGGHSTAPTLSTIDGPGRMKPEIVAPGNTTSTATPRISAAASLLFETAATHPALLHDPEARRPDVIKAALLAGAVKSDSHGAEWTNAPVTEGPERGLTVQPIDQIVGAGLVNINRSHLILTGGRQPAAEQWPPTSDVPPAAWSSPLLGAEGSAWWRFTLTEPNDELSVIATVNRNVPNSFASYSVASFELELFAIDANGAVVPLTGDGGLDRFASGNVRCASPVDNIQHLYVRTLQPGTYAIQIRRTDALPENFNVAVAWYLDHDPAAPIFGDLNGDGIVDLGDLLILLANWGDCPPESACPADLNGDGVVNLTDLLMILAAW